VKGYIASVIRVGSAMMRLRERLFPAVLAMQLFLSVLQLLDAFHVWYFPMKHRWVYYLRFDLGFSLVPVLLPVAFVVLVCLLLRRDFLGVFVSSVVTLFVHFFFGFEAAVAMFSILQIILVLYRFVDLGEFLSWLLVIFTGFETLTLIHWVLLPFGIVSPLTYFADLEMDLFYVAAHLAPLIVVIIMGMWFLRPVIRYVGIDRFLVSRFNLVFGLSREEVDIHPRILLALALIFSIVGALYPYSPKINPNSISVGVDVHWYIEWMAPVEQHLFSVFTVANGSRPIILLLIYVFQRSSSLGVMEVVKYLPVLLNPLLVLSVFFMVSNATEDLEWAGLASLFSATGFTITVGMYSYFLTNILGLVLIFSSLGFLFKTIRTGLGVHLVPALALGFLAVFTHPWTFIQYYAATVLFLFYIYFLEKRSVESLIIITYLGLTGLVDVLKGVMGGLEAYGVVTSTAPKLIELVRFWSNNIFAFRQMYGGLLSNTIFLVIATFGVYLLNRRKPYHLFLTMLLLVSSVYFLMVDGSAQTKLLYNIPFSVLSSSAILFLLRNTTLESRKKTAVLFFSGIYMIVYLLRSLANLV